MGRRPAILRGISGNPDRTRHHVLRQARTGISIDADVGIFVHPGAVVSNVAMNLNITFVHGAGGNIMFASGIIHRESLAHSIIVVQGRIQIPYPGITEVKIRCHQCLSQL